VFVISNWTSTESSFFNEIDKAGEQEKIVKIKINMEEK
jgi:hypothetical protein